MDPQEKPKFARGIVRQVFCRNYSECLGFCAEIDWENFTCEGPCKSYAPEIKDPELWVAEALNCGKMMNAGGLNENRD